VTLAGPWLKEIWRLLAFLAVAFLAGLLLGHMTAFLFGGLLGFLLWQSFRLHRFSRWLASGEEMAPRHGNDLTGELYYQVQGLRSRARRREQALREALDQYRASAAALPDATLVLDADDCIEWMNRSAASLLGLDAGGDIGRKIQNLLRHPDFIRYLYSGDYSGALEISLPDEDERRIEIHIVPYGNRQRLLVARDVTRVHKLEVMRRDFIANVSHELSTPLTVISGYLESLSDMPGASDRLERALGQMREQTDRMRSLVGDLLQISRLELNEGNVEESEVDIPAMLRKLAEREHHPALGKRHEISIEIDDSLYLRGVEKDLYSAFSNLIRNALQYTPAGGMVSVRWHADDGGASFSVRDTGIGIPKELIPRLTERFFRVDAGRSRAAGGTGLGLAIVKHVLRNHQADLRIESKPGEGSLFLCWFPPERVIYRRSASPHP
jgi:two-component system, OmpR family, phosphate regulon sensor histidine kinase PhoR